MHTLPAAIETAIHRQLLAPLAEVLAGHRPARDIESVASDDVVLRLTLCPRRPLGLIAVRTIRTQPVSTRHAVEVAASLQHRVAE
jgi:hypothetical protein